MSDTYQPPAPEPMPEPQAAPMPPTDTPIGTPPPEGTPFVAAFPNATEESVQAAEAAFKDGTAEGMVVNPGPQVGVTAPDQSAPTEPALPPPPVNP